MPPTTSTGSTHTPADRGANLLDGVDEPPDLSVPPSETTPNAVRVETTRRAHGTDDRHRTIALSVNPPLSGRGRSLWESLVATSDNVSSDESIAALLARGLGRWSDCEWSRFGPCFRTDGYETLVYPVSEDAVQTTLGYWQVRPRTDRAKGVGSEMG